MRALYLNDARSVSTCLVELCERQETIKNVLYLYILIARNGACNILKSFIMLINIASFYMFHVKPLCAALGSARQRWRWPSFKVRYSAGRTAFEVSPRWLVSKRGGFLCARARQRSANELVSGPDRVRDASRRLARKRCHGRVGPIGRLRALCRCQSTPRAAGRFRFTAAASSAKSWPTRSEPRTRARRRP